jgi:uncharacterized protein (TIGR03067 family)
MHMKLTAIIVAACLTAAKPPRPEEPKTDKQILQGTWTVVSGEAKGKAAPDEAIKDVRWVIQDNKITAIAGDGTRVLLTFHLDTTQRPRAIDLRNPERKEILQGIYQVTEDRWKVCLGAPGENRPKSFATTVQNKTVVFVFRRAKS